MDVQNEIKKLREQTGMNRKQFCEYFEIPYNRQQLADYLGVDRSGLSVQLCRLRDEGMLTFHKNKIRLIYKNSTDMI